MQFLINLLTGFGGPFLLMLMGAWVSIDPPKPKGRGHWIWFVLFIVVGGAVSWANYQQSQDAFEQARKSDARSADTNTYVHKIATNLDLPSTATLKDISKKIEKLSPHIYRVTAGTTYNVPPENCTINVENGYPGVQTEIYLPKKPFQGEVATVRNMKNDQSNGIIEIWGNGHKIGNAERAYIVSQSDVGGSGYLTMTFDVDQWSVSGMP